MRSTRFSLPVDILAALFLLVCAALMLLSLKNPTSLDDGLRHFSMAFQMREQGILVVPGWSMFLVEGYFKNNPVDPWFLSDVLLIPFTIFPVAKGLQLFVVCEIALLFTSFLLVLRSLRLPPANATIFLLVLVFGDMQFLGRFLLGRPYALMTTLMLFVLYACLERRYILLSLLLMIGVLLSQLFVFSLFLCACAFFVCLLKKDYRQAILLSSATVIGVALGLLLHPHSFLYIDYLVTVFLKIPFLKSIGLSSEMKSGLVDGAFLSVICILSIGFLFAVRLVEKHSVSWLLKQRSVLYLTVCVLPLSVAFCIWVRTIDVLWPLLIVWLASIFVLDRTALWDTLSKLLPKKTKAMRALQYVTILVCIAEIVIMPYLFMRDDHLHALDRYKNIALIPANVKVFNFDWDFFALFSLLRPDLQFTSGIDRSFTYLTDPDVSIAVHQLEQERYKNPSAADVQKIVDAVLKTYPAEYVVLTHGKFEPVIQALKSNQAFGLLSDNKTLAIYAVPDWFRPKK
jgi:hypothetical protein